MNRFRQALKAFFKYRDLYKNIPGFMQTYWQETHEMIVFRSRVLGIIGICLYMSSSVMDQTNYPEHVHTFMLIRISSCLLTFSCFLFGFTKMGQKHVSNLFFLCVLYADLASSYMAALADGFNALYYVGNILLTVGIMMFIPWSPVRSVFYVTLTVVGYVGLNLLYHPFTPKATIPINFLAILIPLSFFAALIAEANRMQQLSVRLKIESANNKLKELDEAKDRFFANMSHELRTPLTLILNPLQSMAKNPPTAAPPREFWESMIANARRLLRQVNAILDISKIDANKMSCHFEKGSLSSMINEIALAAKPGARERQLELDVQNIDAGIESYFDFEKIETVVANLVSNAIKFTPAGGKIALSLKKKGNDQIQISVQDNGPGISKEAQGSLFERFSQVDKSLSRTTKGTGLGLSVSKQFVELHGGSIRVESEPGKGACFTVDLPVVPPTARVSEVPSVDPNKSSKAVENFREQTRATLLSDLLTKEGSEGTAVEFAAENQAIMSKRDKNKKVILYVDDNHDLRKLVKSLLDPHYTVLLAGDGQLGFEQASLYHPDLILSDVMMPILTGPEFCHKVKSDVQLRATPFVLLTARSGTESRIESLKLGADDYVSKPFSDEELLARIQNLITLREQQFEIKRQLRAAREIQRALLPPFQQAFPGLSVEAFYRPSEELSGDFFDFVATKNHLFFYLADVTSHGTASAQVTYLIKGIFQQTISHQPDISIEELFKKVSLYYQSLSLDYDVGLQLAKYDYATRKMQFIATNAPEPLRIPSGEKPESLHYEPSTTISSLPVNAEEIEAEVTELVLRENEIFYFFTDGVYEFKTATSQEFGYRNFMRMVSKLNSEGKWNEQLLPALSAQATEGLPDDITVIRFKAEPVQQKSSLKESA